MEPLICPQCGGQITNYSRGQAFATCGYCATRFLIRPDEPDDKPPQYPVTEMTTPSPKIIAGVVLTLMALGGGFLLTALFSGIKGSSPPGSSTPYSYSPPTRSGTPSPAAPDPNLLSFGGKGTGNGLFQDANSITVDKQGRIYVSDDSLRVQQFDEKGTFLKTFTIPAKTGNYDHARTIDKIAAGDDGKLYVAVGGIIRIYNADSSEFIRVMEMAPDYISDFALKSDGGMDIVYDNDRIETLIVVTKTGKISKRVDGFHTKALDAAISPQETAIAAIRLAVDGVGNIFSIYAFGDLGSYQISSNNDELLIARFTPDGRYVNKFVQTMNSCGIAVDNQSRIYISESSVINVYKNNGEMVSAVTGLDAVNAFALDKDNNIYAVSGDRVIKRPPIQ